MNKERNSAENHLLQAYHLLAKQEEAALEVLDLEMLAEVRIDIAIILVKNGAYQEALAKNLNAEAFLKERNNPALLAKCWRYMAIIYGHLGNLDKRIYYNLLSLEYLRESNNHVEVSKVLNNLGHCYLESGQHNKALPLFLTNLENNKLSDDLYGATMKNLGQLYLKTGQLEKAEAILLKTIAFSKEKKLIIYHAGCCHYLGIIAIKKKQFSKAEKYINQALAIVRPLNIDKRLRLQLSKSKIETLIALKKHNQLKSELTYYQKLNTEINDKIIAQSNKSIQFLYEIHEKEKEQALLKERNAQLKNHNYELKQFAHIVSHDLKQPIRTVNSFTGLLKRELEDNLSERSEEFFGIISSSCQEMISFVNSVLRFAENNAANPYEQVNCNKIMEKVTNNLRVQLLETQGKIVYEDLPIIFGHRSELLQIFQNLVSNSLKFKRKGVPPVVTITATQENRYTILEFSDNGIGIKKNDQEKIFNLFERLDGNHKREGTGIGLSTVIAIIKRYSGKIDIASTPGKGSIFTITFPNYNPMSMVS